MRAVKVNAPGATGVSAPVILDQYMTPQELGLAVELTGGASLTTKVQFSLDDPFATYATDYNTNGVWFDDKNLVSLTSNTAGTLINAAGNHQPARAVRLNNTVWSSGTASLTVVQFGGTS